ncbi:biosynthetic peptidoglycan transglycosylase [uncultured Pedobacter sp.]|uniref:biosynthetic peptidoglycan transglycosylase n=1 Tax=uncultured Pedobacter sp. TaxID=246139 RepID=UPI0025DD42A1|nr:biosynthetic peptidoglycan transglycosylase [uncultured Pedobacter sp.]
MTKELIRIFLLGLFGSNGRVKALLHQKFENFRSRFKLSLFFSAIRISWRGLLFKDLRIGNGKYRMESDIVLLSFSLKKWISNNHFGWLMFNIDTLRLVRCDENANARKKDDTDGHQDANYFNRLLLYCVKARGLLQRNLPNIAIEKIYYFGKVEPLVKKLSILNGKIHCYVNLGFKTEEINANVDTLTGRLDLEASVLSFKKAVRADSVKMELLLLSAQTQFEFNASLKVEIQGLVFDSKKISSSEIHTGKLLLDIEFDLNKKKIEIKSSSGTFWDIPFSFRVFSFGSSWPLAALLFSATLNKKSVNDISFNFVNKLFELDEQTEFDIGLIWRFEIFDLSRQQFEVTVKHSSFGIKNISENFNGRLNGLEYKSDDSVSMARTVKVGDCHNTSYMSFDFIPEKIKAITILCEDPNFYLHPGVDQYFLGQALATNILHGRILRGGSTITMQLVKNIYLSSEVSLFRKLEEAVISILIENVFHQDKALILEAYLNIIEFAPGVYGWKEGADFYFSKPPDDLSLSELVVMTYIIPRPLHFYNALLAGSAQLHTNLSKYMIEMESKLKRSQHPAFDPLIEIDRKIVFAKPFPVLDLSRKIQLYV